MRKDPDRTEYIMIAVIAVLMVIFVFWLCIHMNKAVAEAEAVAEETVEIAEEPQSVTMTHDELQLERREPKNQVQEKVDNTGKLIFSEIMPNNKTTILYNGLEPRPWVEVYNPTSETVNVEGWKVSDSTNKGGAGFPVSEIQPGEYIVVENVNNAKIKESADLDTLRTIYIFDDWMQVVDKITFGYAKKDQSWMKSENGQLVLSYYPTPGMENTKAAYDQLQDWQFIPETLIINEAMVAAPDDMYTQYAGSDWVELKNNSDAPISLDGWYISDSFNKPRKASLPSKTLQPNEITVITCDSIGLSLNSENEILFLSNANGIQDSIYLRRLSHGQTFGRMDGQNGSFYFEIGTPGEENRSGFRRISDDPTPNRRGGAVENNQPFDLIFDNEGTIFYEIGTAIPTTNSRNASSPITISQDTIVRAINMDDNALPSPCATFTYFFNTDYELPIVSLVTDDEGTFNNMYATGSTTQSVDGNMEFCDGDKGFSIPCEIELHGATSLQLNKKGMEVKFHGSYGKSKVTYDLFNGGISSFSNLLLRTGQDINAAMMRNELCQNIALQASDHVLCGRSRYVNVYVNGDYYGVFPLTEKMNEQFYADTIDVDKDDVFVQKAPVYQEDELYKEVFDYCKKNDMTVPENYQQFQELMDVDSLIDWVLLEGYFGNSDITFGNLKYCRSYVDDTRWKFMLYDLDASFFNILEVQNILIAKSGTRCYEVLVMMNKLLKNEEFRRAFVSRAAQLLNGPLQQDVVSAEIDKLYGQLSHDIQYDCERWHRKMSSWESAVEKIRECLPEWTEKNYQMLNKNLNLTEEEKMMFNVDWSTIT